MLITEQIARENLRSRDGKRVFYLSAQDQLTPAARDFLHQERIEILSADQAKPPCYVLQNGATLREKPEHLTHLQGNVLVPKTHPRIRFRGAMDTLEAELLLAQLAAPEPIRQELGQALTLARELIRCDVLGEPVPGDKICGMTPDELRSRSHRPQDYYGVPHFMPTAADGAAILQINRARTAARAAELAGAEAFSDRDGLPTRPDLLLALNRLSSLLYLFMIRLKADGRKENP